MIVSLIRRCFPDPAEMSGSYLTGRAARSVLNARRRLNNSDRGYHRRSERKPPMSNLLAAIRPDVTYAVTSLNDMQADRALHISSREASVADAPVVAFSPAVRLSTAVEALAEPEIWQPVL